MGPVGGRINVETGIGKEAISVSKIRAATEVFDNKGLSALVAGNDQQAGGGRVLRGLGERKRERRGLNAKGGERDRTRGARERGEERKGIEGESSGRR